MGNRRGSLNHPSLWPCAGCKKVDGRKGKNGVQCDNCDAWWHASCGGVDVDAATARTTWRCPHCSPPSSLSQEVLSGIRSIHHSAPSKVPKPPDLAGIKPRETPRKSKENAVNPTANELQGTSSAIMPPPLPRPPLPPPSSDLDESQPSVSSFFGNTGRRDSHSHIFDSCTSHSPPSMEPLEQRPSSTVSIFPSKPGSSSFFTFHY